MAHIDPVFNLRFWRIWGYFCIMGVSNDRTIHSAAVGISFDTRFELIKFYWDKTEVGCTSILHKLGMIRNIRLKWKNNTWNHCIVKSILILSVNKSKVKIFNFV